MDFTHQNRWIQTSAEPNPRGVGPKIVGFAMRPRDTYRHITGADGWCHGARKQPRDTPSVGILNRENDDTCQILVPQIWVD